MTKNLKIIAGSVCIFSLTAFAVSVQAGANRMTVINNYQPHPQHRPVFGTMSSQNFSHQIREIAQTLNLTLDQETQVQEIVTNEKLAALPIIQKIASDRNQLDDSELVLPFDEATVTALATQLGTDLSSLIVINAHAKNRIYALLSPDQQVLFPKIRPQLDRLLR